MRNLGIQKADSAKKPKLWQGYILKENATDFKAC